MTAGPIDHALGFWKPLLDEQELQALASYREPGEPLVRGINAWRPGSAPRPYHVASGGAGFSLFAAVVPLPSVPPSAEVMAEILDEAGDPWSYVLWYPRERAVVVPFDPDAAIESFWREEYVDPARRTILPRPLLSLYYAVFRPLLLGGVKHRLRRLVARRAYAGKRFLQWPVDQSLDLLQSFLLRAIMVAAGRDSVRFAWFWPDGRPYAVALTHDVETGKGLAKVQQVAEQESELGLRSSFNLVPFDYEVPGSLLQRLRDTGFEIGVHGYTHDGRLFSKWRTFLERVITINEVGRQWGASGFRSPATYRNQEWFHLLGFEYDSSVADSAPFEPQPGGCASLFPFPADGLVELPITLSQDHTLFGLLRQTGPEMWLTKLRRIEDAHGMACVLTHPDPATGYVGLPENWACYRDLLDAIVGSGAWTPLPRDLARWWRTRAATPPARMESVEGASLATATLEPSGRITITPPARAARGDGARPKRADATPSRALRVWIDMANSPHVQFFGPLIRELESRGHTVLISAREFAQTTELLDQAGLAYTTIGHHGGKSVLGKGLAIEQRARSLAAWARQNRADVAVHHNSYAQSIAAWTMRIPSITLMDYEHQPANHVSFRLSSIVLVPDSIPADALARYGASWRLRRYPGLKEDFYAASMLAETDTVLGVAGLDADRPLLVLRPPPDLATYHRFENLLWGPLLRYLAEQETADVLLLPRSAGQALRASRLVARAAGNVVIAEHAIVPGALLRHADGVITAGGTMAREAAALGIPAYTLFMGRRGGVDTRLIRERRLIELATPEDFRKIALEKRRSVACGDLARERELVGKLADLVVHAARQTR